MNGRMDGAFTGLLELLREARGFDPAGREPEGLAATVGRRVDLLQLSGVDDYRDHLEVHPEEYTLLFDALLEGTGGFFDDAATWELLRREVVPQLIVAGRSDEPLRIWNAGCAGGEEAYSIALLLAEGLRAAGSGRRARIYATDVDDDALGRAQTGSYTLPELSGIPGDLRSEYLETEGAQASIRADVRRSVVFGHHDLARDAPIRHLDLVICRNTLMYLTAETQARVLAGFYSGLNDGGSLVLGSAESPPGAARLFTERARPVFSRLPGHDGTDRPPRRTQDVDDGRDRDLRLHESAFRLAPSAQLVVDADGVLVMANEEAVTLLGVTSHHVGMRLQDLEISYRPVELRSRMAQAAAEQAPVRINDVPRALPGDRVGYLDVVVTPMLEHADGALGYTVSFVDVTALHELGADLARSRQDLETAYEEIQASNEELVTTNEELQSTVEELETTNEELQSANEELETMNEELESTNGELQAINAEMRSRTDELDRVSAFTESVLTSLRLGVIVVDAQLRVTAWNGRSPDLWGLRADEVVGHPFLSLDMGLPVAELAGSIRQCLAGEAPYIERAVEALTRRGRTIRCRVTCTPHLGARGARDGAVLLVEEIGAPT